jgi:hypothetical protein
MADVRIDIDPHTVELLTALANDLEAEGYDRETIAAIRQIARTGRMPARTTAETSLVSGLREMQARSTIMSVPAFGDQ